MRKLLSLARVPAFALSVLCVLGSAEARADSALYGFFGASTGGNITVLSDPGFDLETALENSPIYGLRVGSYNFPFGFEGTLAYSRANLTGSLSESREATTDVLYAEANILVIVLPGPVKPFVTGGAGLHYLDFNVANLASFSQSKFGYNFGGGLMVEINRLGLRLDVRDHVTTFGLGDFGLGLIGNIIGLDETDARLHNVEVTFGVGITF